MSLWTRIKNWFTGGSSRSSSRSSTRRANTVSNYGGGGSRSYRSGSDGGYTRNAPVETRQQRMQREAKERKKKQEEVTKKLSQITDAKSAGRTASAVTKSLSGVERATQKLSERAKATPPDPKAKAKESSQARATKMLKSIDNKARNAEKSLNNLDDRIKANRKSYNKATGNKYNANTGNKAHDAKARQRIKSGEYQSDPNAEKWEIKNHRIASSAARGALSGVTFGGSELLAQTSKKRKESGAEEFYQKNKHRGAEVAGELVGSLAGFGLTGEASARAVGKLAPKALKTGAERVATKALPKNLIRKAAEAEAKKRFGAGVSEEIIEQIVKRRTRDALLELGKDASINATTGLASDLIHSGLDATKNGQFDKGEFAKSMGRNAAINLGLGAATSLVPAFRVGKRFADDAIEDVAKGTTDALSPLSRASKAEDMDQIRKSMNDAFVKDADESRRIDTNDLLAQNSPFRQADETVRPQAVEQTPQMFQPAEALRELDGKGETWLGSYGHITANQDGSYNLFVNGVGDRTLGRAEAEDYINRAVARLNADEEAIRVTRTSPLTDAETARISEIDDEISRLRADGLEDANAIKDNKYKGVEDYWERQGERGRKETELTREKDTIQRKEPPQLSQIDESAEGISRETERQAQQNVDDFAAMDSSENVGFNPESEAKAKVEEEVNKTSTTDSTGKESWTADEQQELIDKNYRTTSEHTRRGFTTIAVTGDRGFKGIAHEAMKSGDTVIDVYHDKDNLAKGASRVMKMADDGKIDTLINNFREYANGSRKLDSKQTRDQLYDIIAAVDFANANKSEPWAEELYLEACRAGAEQTSVSGLSLHMWQKIAMSSPSHRAKAVRQQILDMFNKNKLIRKEMGKLGKGNKASLEDLDSFLKKSPALREALDALEKMGEATSVDEVQEMASKALLHAREVMPMTFLDQLTQWRYVAMLSSPKTHVRNVVSNIYSGTLGQLRDGITSGIQNGYIKSGKFDEALKKSGLTREDYMKSAGGMSGKAWKDAHIGLASGTELHSLNSKLNKAKMELETLSPTDAKVERLTKRISDLESSVKKKQAEYDKLVGGIKRPQAKKAQEAWLENGYDKLVANAEKFERRNYGSGGKFIFKANDKASKAIGSALETSDAISLERIFRERYDKILTANNWEKLSKQAANGDKAAAERIKKIEEYATQEASYIAALDTYRSYSELAQKLSRFVDDTVFNYDADLLKKVGGGVVHATLPFTKVPINIVRRGIDYSPIGLIKSKKALNDAISAGNITEINRACERLAEGRIGTGIAAIGAGLGFIDPDGMMINTRLDKNDTLDKRKKDAGYQDYSLQVAGRNITMDWLTPTSMTVFTGVEFGRMLRHAFDAMKDENVEFDIPSLMDVPTSLMSSLAEPALQLSVFQGVNNVLEDVVESDNYSKTNASPWVVAMENIFRNYAQSMIPTVLSQVSRTVAPYDYFVTGDTNSMYGINSTLAKLPIVSDKVFGAKTNSWGQIKNEKQGGSDYAKAAAKNLLSPANINKTTWDKTDEKMMNLSKTLGEDIFPKNNYDKEMTFGKNAGDMKIKMSDKELAEYNVQRGKSGRDAMADALENVMFNRWDKDDTGHYTIPHDDNITDAEREKLLKQFDGKGIKEVVAWVIETPNFKNATPAEQRQILGQIYGSTGSDDDESRGAKRSAERYIAGKHGISDVEYDYYNEVPRSAQEALAPLIKDGLITYEQALDFKRNAGKTYYRTDKRGEKGGTVQTYYNKKQMLEYLEKQGYSEEEAAALFNAFKLPQAKEYGASGYRRYGRRRRGYRRRRFRRYGGGSAKAATVPKPKELKEKDIIKGVALGATKSTTSSSKSKKAQPPELKRVKAKIDLPEIRK